MKKKKEGLLFGAFLLLLSNVFSRGLGFFYRVMLVRILGAEGVGLVEMFSPVFSFLLVLAGWGVALAMSKSIAEHSATGRSGEAHGFFRAGLLLLTCSGLLVTVLAFLFLPLIIRYFVADARVSLALQYILPAVFIISVASAYRGAFQGMRQVSAIGVSQSVEQAVRVAAGLLLAFQFIQFGLERAITAVSIATLLGESAGFLYILRLWRKRESGFLAEEAPAQKIGFYAKKLLSYGTSVTFTRLAVSATSMLQALLIPLSLRRAGFDARTATEIYGSFSGVALALFHLPGIFTATLAVSVMPAIAENAEARRGKLIHHRIGNSLQATSVFTLPGMALLYLFAAPLCQWIFHNSIAAAPLRILALGGTFFYLQAIILSILQGLGEVKAILLNSLVSGIALLTGIFFLTSKPSLGITGAAWTAVFCYLLGFLLNFLRLYRVTGVRLAYDNIFLKPALAALLASGAVILARIFGGPATEEVLPTLLLMLLFAALYFTALVLCGGLSIGVWRRIIKR
ncbi:MAG: polysaccharide biosynthesis protein [Clostridiales bacterium]|nr:polysaccharide biosynthesis protein [Clostridiales bacterium]